MPRRAIAKVGWHPGELYPRVGFIVTNLSRPADRVVAFYNKRRDVRTMDQGRQGRNQVDTAATPCGSSFMRSPTILAIVTRLSNRQEECVQRPVKKPDQLLDHRSGCPSCW